MNNICVIGGSGFVGRHIVRMLVARRMRVRVPTRNREHAKDELIILPTVEAVDANVHDEGELNALLAGTDTVINLVGILHERNSGIDFNQAHVELPRKIIKAALANGVTRLLHMSALNADPNGASAYLRSKGEGEKLVRESKLDVTIFRPSVIFGRGDSFLNMFACLMKYLPVFFLACPDAKFQPVFVEDVARAFADSLGDERTFGKAYDLCGPKAYTLRELVEYVGGTTGNERTIIGLPDSLSYLQALMMEWLPVKLMTRDNYYSMKKDSVCGCDFPFSFQPTPMEAVVPTYLAQNNPRARYYGFRYKARR